MAAEVDQKNWRDALVSEIERYAIEAQYPLLDSIFFGGGTPSLMPPDTVGAVIEAARKCWPLSNEIEITLEANPTSVEAGRFQGYRDAGVNRVSMGIQALNDPDLRMLGRLHSVAEARKAFELARRTFPRVSFDLIYARQNQTLSAWKQELHDGLNMAADHLSLYQLTIEDGTAFGDRFARGGLRGLPDEDLAADMFELTQDLTAAAGLSAYEISNHAAAGAESKHNLIYWNSGNWIGVGPGAHGRLTLGENRIATEAFLSPNEWLAAAQTSGSGESKRAVQNEITSLEEALIMGLRLHKGVSLGLANRLKLNNKISHLVDDGFIETSEDTLRATRKGRPVLNAILRELIA